MKKISLLFICFLNVLNISAEVYEGSCGTNVSYSLDTSTGLLSITGTGAMADYSYPFYAPWYSNSSYVKTVEISNGVTSIGNYAFNDCDLTSITIPNSVTSIGSGAFYGCWGLTSVTIPNSVTSIGYDAFWNCSCLTSISVENGNEKYDSHNNCNAIIETASNTLIAGCKNTVIPNSVTSIEYGAFRGCSGLTSIEIPNSVTSIGNYAFYFCSSLKSVKSDISVPFTFGADAFSGISSNCVLAVPYGTKDAYIAKGWTTSVFKGGIKEIMSVVDGIYYGFNSNNKQATVIAGENKYSGNVTIPSSVTFNDTEYSVTSIGQDAFYGCWGLTSVTIPNGVTEIGNSAFSGCTSLTSIEIPNSVTSIGEQAFYYCPGLTSIVIPNNVTSIGRAAFHSCSGIKSVTIGNSVKSIGWGAFYGCSGLKSVTIGNSMTEIGNQAFWFCEGLTEVHITDVAAWCKIKFSNNDSNPLYYAHHLFMDGKEITDLIIPNSVTEIGDYAFDGCSSLTSVTIPTSVTSIGNNAFYGCSGLTEVTIPNSVTTIGEYAFAYCSGLTSVHITDLEAWCKIKFGSNPLSAPHLYLNGSEVKDLVIPNSVTEIGNRAFSGFSGLTSVTIPNSVTEIGDDAFSGCEGLTAVNITDLAAWCNIDFLGNTSNPLNYAHHLFMDDKEITDLVIPNGVTSIGSSAFYNCSDLTSVTIPTSVTEIEDDAFSGCEGLTAVNITDIAAWCNIDFLGNYSNPLYYAHHLFMDGKEITDLVIPTSVTSIGEGVFKYCSGLTSVTIGNGVTEIGNKAFFGCTGLTSVACEATSVPSTGSDVFNNVPLRSAKLYVQASALEDYKATEPWSGFGSILAIEVIAINEENFPDENFRNFILAQDYGQDGVLTSTEIVPIKYMQCHNKEIKNLKGIEYFTALQSLYCYQNNIKDDAMDILVNSLPNYNSGSLYVIYNEDEGNIMTATQVATAKAKGWTPYYYDGSEWKKIKVQAGNKIIIEGEIMQDISAYTTDKCTITPITIDDTRVSLRGCLQIYPKSTNGTWDVTYNIEDLIPGKYNVHVVTLPKTMADETARELPVKYKLKLQYSDQDGQEIVKDCGAFASTQGEITDNVAEGIDISGNNVKITLSGNANKKKASSETSEMYLDYMYLELATLRGDVNGDGVVNGTDIQAVINVIVDGEYDERADVNEDDKVNGTDIQEVINIIVNAE